MTEEPCPFCEIVAGRAQAQIVEEWTDTLAFVPLDPMVEGHLLVIPKVHVQDFTDNPRVAGDTMERAGELAAGMGSYNVITSKGLPATQSVFHLHLHLVPRSWGDGVALPWYSGKTTRKGKTTCRSHRETQ